MYEFVEYRSARVFVLIGDGTSASINPQGPKLTDFG